MTKKELDRVLEIVKNALDVKEYEDIIIIDLKQALVDTFTDINDKLKKEFKDEINHVTVWKEGITIRDFFKKLDNTEVNEIIIIAMDNDEKVKGNSDYNAKIERWLAGNWVVNDFLSTSPESIVKLANTELLNIQIQNGNDYEVNLILQISWADFHNLFEKSEWSLK